MKEIKKWGGAREGSGRSTLFKGENKTRVHLYLTERAADILGRLADDEGVSRSDMLNKIIIEYENDRMSDFDYRRMIDAIGWITYENVIDTSIVLVAERSNHEDKITRIIENKLMDYSEPLNVVLMEKDEKWKEVFYEILMILERDNEK